MYAFIVSDAAFVLPDDVHFEIPFTSSGITLKLFSLKNKRALTRATLTYEKALKCRIHIASVAEVLKAWRQTDLLLSIVIILAVLSVNVYRRRVRRLRLLLRKRRRAAEHHEHAV